MAVATGLVSRPSRDQKYAVLISVLVSNHPVLYYGAMGMGGKRRGMSTSSGMSRNVVGMKIRCAFFDNRSAF